MADNPPVFPYLEAEAAVKLGFRGIYPDYMPVGGLTLRDLFAGLAMAGQLAATPEPEEDRSFPSIATWAYGYADAMLAEREKKVE